MCACMYVCVHACVCVPMTYGRKRREMEEERSRFGEGENDWADAQTWPRYLQLPGYFLI